MTSYFVTDRNELGTISTISGRVTILGITKNEYWDIAVSPTGELFGNVGRQLYRIEFVAEGILETPAAVMPSGFINSLEFASDGTLYAAGTGLIYAVDVVSGSSSTTGAIPSTSAGDLYVLRDNVVVATNSLDLVSNNLLTGEDVIAFDGTPSHLYGLIKTADNLYGLFDKSMVRFDIEDRLFHFVTLTGDQITGVFNGATSDEQFLRPSEPGETTDFVGTNGLDVIDRPYTFFDISFIERTQEKFVIQFGDVEAISLFSVERVELLDGTLALDTDGNAGQAYRLYQAAFERTPDTEGLGYWIGRLDSGTTSLNAIADSFLNSPEFVRTYGTKQTVANSEFVELLYLHTLGRNYDQSGFDYWVERLDNDQTNRSDLLAFFSESDENKAKVADAIDDGIWYA